MRKIIKGFFDAVMDLVMSMLILSTIAGGYLMAYSTLVLVHGDMDISVFMIRFTLALCLFLACAKICEKVWP